MEVTGALYAGGPWSHPEARPLPDAAGMLDIMGAGSHAEARPEPSEEGCRGVAMTGAHALSRLGVAAPGCEGVMPGCMGVAPPCTRSKRVVTSNGSCTSFLMVGGEGLPRRGFKQQHRSWNVCEHTRLRSVQNSTL